MDESNKVRIEVEVDGTLLERAERAGLDIPQVVERALLDGVRVNPSRSGSEERERLRREVAEEVKLFNAHVERHGLLSDEWRNFF